MVQDLHFNNRKDKQADSRFKFRLVLTLLFTVGLFSLSSAQSCGVFGTYLQNGVCVPDVIVNLSTIVMLISLTVAAILYMIGYALENAKLISFSKDLIFQLLGSALILGMYLGIVASLNFWAPSLLSTNFVFSGGPSIREISGEAVGNWETLQSHAEHYVNCLLDYSKESIKQILFLTQIISVVASSSLNLAIGSFSQFIPIFPTGGGLIPIASLGIGALATIVIQLTLQLKFLKLWFAFFNIILPLGLLFRSFPYTRAAGAAMIAITIGFTIFLPIFYLVIEDIGYNYLPADHKDVCNDTPVHFTKLKEFLKVIGLGFKTAFNDATKVIEDEVSNEDYTAMFEILAIQATILPLVAYLVVLNITKRIAEILGGEIDFSTLVRLI